MRIDVYNGWIELRDPDLVPERLRRPVFESSIKGQSLAQEADNGLTEQSVQFFSEFNDLVAIALIGSWSFGDTVTIDGLLDLPSKSYDDIRKATSPYLTKLIPDFGVDVDPKAITEQSSE